MLIKPKKKLGKSKITMSKCEKPKTCGGNKKLKKKTKKKSEKCKQKSCDKKQKKKKEVSKSSHEENPNDDSKWKKKRLDIIDDPRFSHIISDPRYREVPKEDTKIKLDSRFTSVLKDQNFMISDSLDPRGRPKSYGTKETLDKFYEIDSDEDESEDGDHLDADKQSLKDRIPDKNKTDEFLHCLLDPEKDFARGEEFFSEDSSDDDSSTSEEEDEEMAFGEFEWGELDKEAQWDCDGNEVEETNRFAVCDMDWDRIKAIDLMVLFSSFCSSGVVKKVTIYPSEFGKARLKEEEEKGPQELLQVSKSKKKMDAEYELNDLEKISKGVYNESTAVSSLHIEALRRYQRNRLKYYYAVVECDSVETARTIYKECDRTHFDVVGVTLDLRYIPSDMEFDEVPHDECLKVPANYVSEKFSTMALQEAKPTLTWDETDNRRRKVIASTMTKALKKERFDEDVIKDYIGDSEDDEDDLDCQDDEDDNDGSASEDETTKENRIAKFRSLISEIDEKEKEKNDEFWNMNDDFETSACHDDNSEGEDSNDDVDNEENDSNDVSVENKLTPFEKFLSKKKEKRKIGRKLKKKSTLGDEDSNNRESEEDGESLLSDSEERVFSRVSDMEDTGEHSTKFTKRVVNESEDVRKNKKTGKAKNRRTKKTVNDDSNTKTIENAQESSLSLLIMDEEKEDKKHFDMRKIIEKNKKNEKNSKKKRKNIEVTEDSINNFEIDWTDHRFSALFTSGNFHLDPSHPKFQPGTSLAPLPGQNKTNSPTKKKRKQGELNRIPTNSDQASLDSSICNLIESIRKKTSKLK